MFKLTGAVNYLRSTIRQSRDQRLFTRTAHAAGPRALRDELFAMREATL